MSMYTRRASNHQTLFLVFGLALLVVLSLMTAMRDGSRREPTLRLGDEDGSTRVLQTCQGNRNDYLLSARGTITRQVNCATDVVRVTFDQNSFSGFSVGKIYINIETLSVDSAQLSISNGGQVYNCVGCGDGPPPPPFLVDGSYIDMLLSGRRR